jgi:hypothetical protein
MYLSELDIVAITIALVSLMALVITSATANARLTRDRNYWRRWAMYTDEEKALSLADERECSDSER